MIFVHIKITDVHLLFLIIVNNIGLLPQSKKMPESIPGLRGSMFFHKFK